MALTVEDGTGLPDADSYVSTDDFDTYAEEMNLNITTLTDEAKEALLRKSTQYIERTYSGRWPGTKLNGRDQALAWPREDAEDYDGEEIDDDEVPSEVIAATLEAARIELTTSGTLTPTPVSQSSGQIKRQVVGPIEREFFESTSNTSSARASIPSIDDILRPLIGSSGSGSAGYLKRA